MGTIDSIYQNDQDLTWDATAFLPERQTLESLREAAAECQACDLYRTGTQTVFGEGARESDVLFIGEQPGDYEDRAGQPFVGPAGRVLDDALQTVGIDRKRVYVTNAVKHFKWVARGKRRIHSKPNAREIRACLPWLHAELALVKPTVIVCLGATAAQALFGASFRVTQQRGRPITGTEFAPYVLATVHPASILRAEPADRDEQLAAFVQDLREVQRLLEQRP